MGKFWRWLFGWILGKGAEGVYQDALVSGATWKRIRTAILSAFTSLFGGGTLLKPLDMVLHNWTASISLAAFVSILLFCAFEFAGAVRALSPSYHVTPLLTSPESAQKPSAVSALDGQTSASVPLVRRGIFLFIVLGAFVFVVIALLVINRPHDTTSPTVTTSDVGTGPTATFNKFDDIQKKIMRTMWDQQDRIGYGSRWLLPVVRDVPIAPEYALPEYVEFNAHLDPLTKQGYLDCNYTDTMQRHYCGLTDNGILLAKSVGDAIHGIVYILPQSLFPAPAATRPPP